MFKLDGEHSFIFLPSAMSRSFSLGGEQKTQHTEVSQGSACLLGASCWACPREGLRVSSEGQNHHGLISWDLFLQFALKLITIQFSCGQSMTSTSPLLRQCLRRFPNISIYPSISPICVHCHFPPTSSTGAIRYVCTTSDFPALNKIH